MYKPTLTEFEEAAVHIASESSYRELCNELEEELKEVLEVRDQQLERINALVPNLTTNTKAALVASLVRLSREQIRGLLLKARPIQLIDVVLAKGDTEMLERRIYEALRPTTYEGEYEECTTLNNGFI